MPPRMNTRGYTRGGNIYYRDNLYSGTRGASLWETAPMLAALSDPSTFFLYRDDFRYIDSTLEWALVTENSGAATILDAANGVVNIATGGTNNNESYLSSLAENWLFAASKPLWFEARVALTEPNVNDANLIVGLSDTVAADSLLDNGAGPMASYDGAVFFKVDGGTVWQFETSNAATQVTTASVGAFLSNTWYRVGFIFDPLAGTTGEITPYLNGVAGTAHAVTLSGLEEMHILLGCKCGGTNVAPLRVDSVQVLAVR